jgi:hypothetical protein
LASGGGVHFFDSIKCKKIFRSAGKPKKRSPILLPQSNMRGWDPFITDFFVRLGRQKVQTRLGGVYVPPYPLANLCRGKLKVMTKIKSCTIPDPTPIAKMTMPLCIARFCAETTSVPSFPSVITSIMLGSEDRLPAAAEKT